MANVSVFFNPRLAKSLFSKGGRECVSEAGRYGSFEGYILIRGQSSRVFFVRERTSRARIRFYFFFLLSFFLGRREGLVIVSYVGQKKRVDRILVA